MDCLKVGKLIHRLRNEKGYTKKTTSRGYEYKSCGKILTATGEADISCCGRKLSASLAKPSDEKHNINVDIIDDEFYITFDHEIKKVYN